MKATVEHHHGAYLIRRGRSSELIQTDWDYPATAGDLGWSLARVQRNPHGRILTMTRTGFERYQLEAARVEHAVCWHRGTDGTVTCPDCGITATTFIQAAARYLDARASY